MRKQVLKPLAVLDSCEAAAVWLKWHAAGAFGLASLPGATPPPTTNLLLTEARPSTAVGPLWSSSTLLRCAAKRMRTASGLGEAAAKLLACACGGVWPCGRVASPFLANTAVRSILL